MNTILTDDERRQAIQSIVLTSPGTADQIARAIESAVLAKRAQQAPAAWLVEGMHEGRLIAHQVHLTSADALQLAAVFARHYPTVHTKPLYTHPSPQQADRQRVPDGCSFLCYAWGESDRPCAAIVSSRSEVRQFLIDEWLGEEGDELDDAMARFDTDPDDGNAWDGSDSIEWKFEIGGIRITKICDCTPRAMLAAAPESPAQGEARKDRMQKVRDFIQADADLARGIASTEAPAQEKSNG